MHLSILVVGQRILLKSVGHHRIRNLYGLFFLGFYHEFKNIQQFPCVSTGIPQHGVGLQDTDVLFLQYHILGQSQVQQFQQVLLLEGFQHIQLTPGEQRTNHFERRILGSGANQRHDTRLHCPQ